MPVWIVTHVQKYFYLPRDPIYTQVCSPPHTQNESWTASPLKSSFSLINTNWKNTGVNKTLTRINYYERDLGWGRLHRNHPLQLLLLGPVTHPSAVLQEWIHFYSHRQVLLSPVSKIRLTHLPCAVALPLSSPWFPTQILSSVENGNLHSKSKLIYSPLPASLLPVPGPMQIK